MVRLKIVKVEAGVGFSRIKPDTGYV
ncbi:hypothetical protein SPIROBIBN47_210047 [uncultured spirochete]|uniref:Uncharacterized protein n=1 Tax=uncultured spirochete TaxID=156406 RepID=A0A3P3XHB9_9SPIR|nr:hypothetical protein SPIROBIBN47_210047 [uncultured spirochete]